MAEAAFGIYMITLAVVCGSVYACFKGIAWVIANGWRSMLGLVTLRGEAVLTVDEPEPEPESGKPDWNYDDVESIATLCREVVEHATDDGEEPDPDAVHFRLWRAEVVGERGVRRRLRQMDRSDR